jgi:hypothetical protein
MGPLDWLKLGQKMTPFVLPLAQWTYLSCAEFASWFKDPFLRKAVAQMFSWDEAPVMMGMMLLA